MTEAQRVEEKEEVDRSLDVAFDLLLTLQQAREAEGTREGGGVKEGFTEEVEEGVREGGGGSTTATSTTTTAAATATGEGAGANAGVEELGYETVRMLLVELAESHRVIETGPGGVDGPAFAELETLLFGYQLTTPPTISPRHQPSHHPMNSTISPTHQQLTPSSASWTGREIGTCGL